MDLRLYYQKIRDLEARIDEEFPIVVSRETSDGGKEGMKTEVPKHIAAKLIVDGLAQIASPDEVRAFKSRRAEAKRMADQAAASSRLQVAVLSSAELEILKGKSGSTKG